MAIHIRRQIPRNSLLRVASGILLVGWLGTAWLPAQDDLRRNRNARASGSLRPELAAKLAQEAADKAEDDLYTYASLAYSNGYHKIAADRLQTYILNYPKGRHLQAAYFRLGESKLKLGDKKGAERAFITLVSKHKEGEFLALAAYRVASLNYQAKDPARALIYFAITESAANDNKPILQKALEEATKQGDTEEIEEVTVALKENAHLWLSSAYYRAYCLATTNRPEEAIAVYKIVTAETEDNEYLETSLREVVRLTMETADKTGAIAALEELSAKSSDEKLKTEAMIRAAMLYGDGDEVEKAQQILETALGKNPGGYWGAVGYYTLVQLASKQGDFPALAEAFRNIEIQELPSSLRPKLLLTMGNAQRKQEQYVQAIETYGTAEEYYATSDEAVEAGYLKLICFYKVGDQDLPEFVANYVLNMTKRGKRTFIDRALLLAAEQHFSNRNFEAAGSSYASIEPQNIPKQIRPSMLYNRGWCENEIGLYRQASLTLTSFLTDFPDHELAPSVYASRGLAYRQLGDRASALRDFTHILEHYPDTAAAEMAFQQSGLVYGEQREWLSMITAFDALIEKFPESIALAEAHFFSGKGRFDLKRFTEAIPLLRKSVELDDSYFPRAQLRIVLCNYFLQNTDQLSKEIDLFFDKNPEGTIDAKVLSWLGASRFEENAFPAAAKYLRLGVTPDKPESTLPIVWMYLAQAESKSGLHEGAIQAINFYLDFTNHPTSRARGFLIKTQTHLAAGNLDEADEAAREGLMIQKEGRINAELLIAQGDVSMARKDYQDAAAKYIVVSEIFEDSVITPSAMEKAAQAYQEAGMAQEAKQVRKDLAKRFPREG